MSTENTSDNFLVAAMRHYIDGNILEKEERWNNAMCHYAFSAECFIKVLYEQVSNCRGSKLNHGVEETFDDLIQYYSYLRMNDVTTDVMLGQVSLPTNLFKNHPKRRYWDDFPYTREEVHDAGELVNRMMRELVVQLVDGRLFLDGGLCSGD